MPALTLAAWSLEKISHPLVIFGLIGQCVFMMRFVVQWFASERRGRSHVPIAFWYLSVAGALMLLTYAILDEDPVILLGQSLGMVIYLRNLWLIYRRRWQAKRIINARNGERTEPVLLDAASESD